MNDTRRKTALALLVAGLGSAPAWGQNQTLDDVVISASRAQQRSFDAPAAVEAVERETIQSAGPQVNLSESLTRVPGLTILNRQNYAQDLQLSIRGFGARSAFGIRGIRLLIDGIPATTPDGQGQGSSIALTSTERIEVLRGPLALMYGNSAGGVIQAWTREAPEVPEFSVQGYVGSYGLRRSDVQMAGRVGTVGLVADYSTLNTDGFRDNSATERKQFNSKISFGPDAGTRVNLVFNHFDMPLAEDPLGLTAAQLAADRTQAGTNALAQRTRKITRQNQLGSSITHELDRDRSLTARLYFGTRDNLQYLASGNWVGLDRHYYGTGLQYNAQTRIGATPLRWVAGYEFDRSVERRQGGGSPGGEKDGTLSRDEDNQSENSDVFVQGTALLAERWSLTGGVRRSTVRLLSEDYFLGNGNGSGHVRYSASNPVLGLTWHAADTLNLYANYGKGFETPTLVEVAYLDTGAVTPAFNTTLAAARSRHLEAGAKWVPAAGSRVDFTVYDIETTDEIVISRSSFGQSAFKNAPGTTRRGWELAGRTLLNPNWRALLSASAIEARYNQAFTNGTTPVADGNKLPGIPQHFLFGELLWSQARLDVARPTRLGTQAGVELVRAGRLYANDTNTASADGYAVWHLKASHGWALGKGNVTAYARIDNVGDKAYVGSVIVNQAANQFYEPAPGRNWTLGARLNLPL
ncbi:MAG: TonB-dependent receptor family protein [Hylemonella sp.]|uniref:TonB-dependent receptor family protein n=1 Tax=Hylemonella sp. TaxID=2066020 RepID=UPI00391A0A92